MSTDLVPLAVTPAKQLGQVITFSSYRGGTGRSLAVANIACLLARRPEQPKVLIVDFDLPAPGQHYLLSDHLTGLVSNPCSTSKLVDVEGGVLELMEDLSRRVAPFMGNRWHTDIDADKALAAVDRTAPMSYVISTDIPNLHLMKAGRFDSRYTSRIHDVDWANLSHYAPSTFTALATRLCEKYDYVLVDTTSGIGNLSTICASLLSQRLVMMFNLNRSGIVDSAQMAYNICQLRNKANDTRFLELWPLATRFPHEYPRLLAQARHGEHGFQPAFEKIVGDMYGHELSLATYFDELYIAECSAFSGDDDIVALGGGNPATSALLADYARLADRLAGNIPPWRF